EAPGQPARRPQATWLLRCDVLLVRLEGATDGHTALDVGSELDERQLNSGERGGDVEDVEPPDVADPEDARLELTLPGGKRDAVPLAEVAEKHRRFDAVRSLRRRHDRCRVVVRREELEAHGLETGASRAAEPCVPLERGVEAVVQDHPEGDV